VFILLVGALLAGALIINM